ncbi:MAG: CapA family protein [Clostridia bacterium]|nr:CapA family protein [Clostridia bacterium]
MKKWLSLLLAASLLLMSASGVAEYADEDDEDLLIEDIIEEVVTEKKEILDTDGSSIITITCTGDFTIGGDSRKKKNIFEDELKEQGGDINFTMQNMREYFLEDDMTLVNFEGTLTESTYVPANKRENQFLFSAPPSYVSILSDNGIEAVSLENNHIMDHGQEVYEETQRTLEEAGIVWSNSEHMGIFEVKGIQIAMLSYLCIDRYDQLWDKVPADIAEAKERYPLVIVSFHWGNELDYSPTNNQIRMGRLAVDAGADLVIGHHSHRMNPIEEYNGVYICYSLGNFCFSGNSKPSDMSSFVFQIRFRVKDGVCTSRGFRIIPIRISSRSNRNDFIPTPYTTGSNIDSVLTVLQNNGRKLEYAVKDYPLDWK